MADPLVSSLTLTQENAKALRYTGSGQPQIYWDDRTVGLGLRLTAGGARSFVLRYRVNGRQRVATLGATSNHSVTEARHWAREGLAKADKGEDFQAHAERQRALGSMSEVWRRYVDEHVKAHGAERTAGDLDSIWVTHLAKTFGSKRVTEIDTAAVRAWHRRASQPRQVTVKRKDGSEWQRTVGGDYIANRALQALKAAINWQIAEGTLPDGFRNPCEGVRMNDEKPRDVILTPAQVPALARAIAEHPDKYAGAFVWLLMRTGARRGELMSLEWANVDFKVKSVRFVDTKNGTDRSVPLDAAAVKLLKGLPRVEGNAHVFPGRWDRGHRADFKGAWVAIRKSAGLPNLHLHDLRRSVGSWLGAAGYSAPMIGELLGHKSEITSRVYIKLGDLDVKRALVEEQAGLLNKALRGKKRVARDE